MAEYSKIIEGRFTSTGAAKFISLPMLPRRFEIFNQSNFGSTANPGVVKEAWGFSNSAPGTAYLRKNTNGAATDTSTTVTTNGFTFVSAGTPTFGTVVTESGAGTITQANPANINITAHGFITGDTVWLYGTTGMLQIAGVPYTVTVVDADNFTIRVDSSGFAAAGTAAFAKKLLYPDLYIPFNSYITSITTGATTTIVTSVNHNFVVGQEVSFVIPDGWGMTELNGLKGYVTSVTASTGTVVVNIDTSSGFTAFAYPTSAVAGAGITFPQIIPIGDANTGYSGPTVPTPQTIPGAFAANTRNGVLLGSEVYGANGNVIVWRAEYPDQIIDG